KLGEAEQERESPSGGRAPPFLAPAGPLILVLVIVLVIESEGRTASNGAELTAQNRKDAKRSKVARAAPAREDAPNNPNHPPNHPPNQSPPRKRPAPADWQKDYDYD